jgi:HAD superfamily hydrolase (TIGR01509 family)
MPFEAVIFDMDGVIVASEDYWWESRVEWAAKHGKTWTHDDQRLAMGRNTAEWAAVMQERLHLPEIPLQQIMDEMTALVVARMEAQLPLLPGAVEAVQLAASRYRVALASGSPIPIIKRVMALTGLDQIFEVMVYGDDQPRGKPHPDIWLAACNALGVEPARCVGIEDSSNGVRSLVAAGMTAIAAPSPGFPLPDEIVALADAHLPSLQAFDLALLERLERAKGLRDD